MPTRIEVRLLDVWETVPNAVSDIRDKLIAFDKALPQPYKALVGTSYMTDPATRYVNPTHDEVMGGARQSE